MERRIGSALILIEDSHQVAALNLILSKHNKIILGRQGIPLRDRDISIISIVMEGTTDEIGALAGQIGRLKGVQVKTIITRK